MFKRLKNKIKKWKDKKEDAVVEKPSQSDTTPSTLSDSLKALEPRIMLDAAAVATGSEVIADGVAEEQAHEASEANFSDVDVPAVVENTEKLFESLAELQLPVESSELIFVDRSVDDYETLMAEINPSAEIIYIDLNSDGVQQIADALSTRSNVDAIHIISHGDAGQLQLGNATLDQESMQGEYADELQTIGKSFSQRADIFIYGCNFGEGYIGTRAMTALADATTADVAASDDLTGSANPGGDWDLEKSVGEIDNDSLFEKSGVLKWEGLLTLTVNQSATDAQMATELTPGGSVTISNPLTPPSADIRASGTFTNDNAALGMTSGVVFSTGFAGGQVADGTAGNIVSVNNTNLNSDDADLDTIYNGNQVDRSEFTFQITPATGINKVSFTYQIATEENMSGSGSPPDPDAFGVFYSSDGGSSWTKVIGNYLGDGGLTWTNNTTTDTASGTGIEGNWISNLNWGTINVTPGTTYDVKVELADYDNNTATDTAVFMDFVGSSLRLDADGSTAGSNFSTTFIENSTTTTVIDSDATLANYSTANISSATLQITNYNNTQDSLNFTNQLGVTGAWNAGTGTLTLTGPASNADFLTALKSVTYQNSSENRNTTARTVSVIANDGTTNSNTTTTTIAITSVNDKAIVDLNGPSGGINYSTTFTEDVSGAVPISASAAATVVDYEGSPVTLRIVAANITNGASEILRFGASQIAMNANANLNNVVVGGVSVDVVSRQSI